MLYIKNHVKYTKFTKCIYVYIRSILRIIIHGNPVLHQLSYHHVTEWGKLCDGRPQHDHLGSITCPHAHTTYNNNGKSTIFVAFCSHVWTISIDVPMSYRLFNYPFEDKFCVNSWTCGKLLEWQADSDAISLLAARNGEGFFTEIGSFTQNQKGFRHQAIGIWQYWSTDTYTYYCICIYNYIYTYMSNRKNPGNTKYVFDGHWFMKIDGNC